MKLTSFRFIGVLAILACISACGDDSVSGPQHAAEAPFDFVVVPTGQHTLIVEGITGSIEIVGTTLGSDFRIQGRRRVKAYSRSEAEERLANLEVDILESAEAITARTLQPSHPNGIGYEVEYEISVPLGVQLQVSQVTGAVLIHSANSGVEVQNVTGSVVLQEIECSANVDVITGSIVGSIELPAGDEVHLAVVTGTVSLSIPANTSAALSASVVTGRLTFAGLDVVDRDPRENVVVATLGSGDGVIQLSSVTGSISVVGR